MEDYADAAKRHFDDAKLLHSNTPSRLANASHLYGFAVECALKSIMLGVKSKSNAPRVHLPALFDEFKNHSVAKGNDALVRGVKKYAAKFTGWTIEQRYHNQNVFSVQAVKDEAEAAKNLLALREQFIRKGI
jgi:hypothetical protein